MHHCSAIVYITGWAAIWQVYLCEKLPLYVYAKNYHRVFV